MITMIHVASKIRFWAAAQKGLKTYGTNIQENLYLRFSVPTPAGPLNPLASNNLTGPKRFLTDLQHLAGWFL